MAIDRATGADQDAETVKEPAPTARRTPPDRPGTPGAPSRADSRAGAAAANAGSDDRARPDAAEDGPESRARRPGESAGEHDAEAVEERAASPARTDTAAIPDDDTPATGDDPDVAGARRFAGPPGEMGGQAADEAGDDPEPAGIAARGATRGAAGEAAVGSAGQGRVVTENTAEDVGAERIDGAADGLDDLPEAENEESPPAAPERSPVGLVPELTGGDLPPEGELVAWDPVTAADATTPGDGEIPTEPHRRAAEQAGPYGRRAEPLYEKADAGHRDRRTRSDTSEVGGLTAEPRDGTMTRDEVPRGSGERPRPGGPYPRAATRREASDGAGQYREPYVEGPADEFSAAYERGLVPEGEDPVFAEAIADAAESEDESGRD